MANEEELKGLEMTVDDMLSSDYKARFRAEYQQLRERCTMLSIYISKCEEGKEIPTCNIDILINQLHFMSLYKSILIKRSVLEDIDLV